MSANRELVPSPASNCCCLLAHLYPEFCFLETNSWLSLSLILTLQNLDKSYFFFSVFFNLLGLLTSVNIQ